MTRVRVDASKLRWENGLDVMRAMAPEFRENLGPEEQTAALFALYDQKTLLHDRETTRRIDLIAVKPGYRDLTNAYHDSVEECLVLTGGLTLDGEGKFVAGDYFWRPPGYVHAAATEVGFTALLVFQGEDPNEGSGPTSRRIQPDHLAGTNQLYPDQPEVAIGPRGWVRHQPTSLLPWIPGRTWSTARRGQLASWDLDRMEVRVLSENPVHGGQTCLLHLTAGFRAPAHSLETDTDLYVLDGRLEQPDDELGPGSFVHRPSGAAEPPTSSTEGAVALLWSRGWMTAKAARP